MMSVIKSIDESLVTSVIYKYKIELIEWLNDTSV